MIPNGPGEVTAEWLTRVLGWPVDAVRVEPLQSMGFTGPIARLHLSSDDGPASVFAKFPTPGMSVLGPEHHQREVDTYLYGLPTTGLRAPRLYHGEVATDGQGVLLLEDIAGTTGDPFGSLGVGAATEVIRELARLHSSWWQCDDKPWIARPELDPNAMLPAWQLAIDEFVRRYEDRVPTYIAGHIGTLRAGYARLVRRMLEVPHSLIHADLNPDNILLVDRDDGRPMIIDWQLAHLLPVVFDLAQFISGALTVDERRDAEVGLLDLYCDELATAGVSYDRDQLGADYRVGLAFRLTIQLRHWSRTEPEGRHRRHSDHFFNEQRVMTAVVDHDALAWLA